MEKDNITIVAFSEGQRHARIVDKLAQVTAGVVRDANVRSWGRKGLPRFQKVVIRRMRVQQLLRWTGGCYLCRGASTSRSEDRGEAEIPPDPLTVFISGATFNVRHMVRVPVGLCFHGIVRSRCCNAHVDYNIRPAAAMRPDIIFDDAGKGGLDCRVGDGDGGRVNMNGDSTCGDAIFGGSFQRKVKG